MKKKNRSPAVLPLSLGSASTRRYNKESNNNGSDVFTRKVGSPWVSNNTGLSGERPQLEQLAAPLRQLGVLQVQQLLPRAHAVVAGVDLRPAHAAGGRGCPVPPESPQELPLPVALVSAESAVGPLAQDDPVLLLLAPAVAVALAAGPRALLAAQLDAPLAVGPHAVAGPSAVGPGDAAAAAAGHNAAAELPGAPHTAERQRGAEQPTAGRCDQAAGTAALLLGGVAAAGTAALLLLGGAAAAGTGPGEVAAGTVRGAAEAAGTAAPGVHGTDRAAVAAPHPGGPSGWARPGTGPRGMVGAPGTAAGGAPGTGGGPGRVDRRGTAAGTGAAAAGRGAAAGTAAGPPPSTLAARLDPSSLHPSRNHDGGSCPGTPGC